MTEPIIFFVLPLPRPLQADDGLEVWSDQLGGDELLRQVGRDDTLADIDPTEPVKSIRLTHHIVPRRRDLASIDAMLRVAHEQLPWARNTDKPPALDKHFEHEFASSVIVAGVWNRGGADAYSKDRDQYVAQCLDQAIEAVQQLQRAAYLHGPTVGPLLSPSDLPVAVACAVGEPAGEDIQVLQPITVVVNEISLQLEMLTSEPGGSEADVQKALNSINAGNPFLPCNDLHREAQWSWRTGSHWSALIQAAAAAELFLYTMAQMLVWEDGAVPEDARRTLKKGRGSPRSFAAQHVGSRLGGTWDKKRDGPVRDWVADLIDKRNLALHTGAPVTEEDANRGLQVLDGLYQFVASRLVDRERLPQYPPALRPP